MQVNEVATLAIEEGIATLTIDSPPVNALGLAVRQGLNEGFRMAADDAAVHGVILTCGGRTFFAGADISEFGRPIAQPDLRAVQEVIENFRKPVVAAIHGTALGGGLEIALTCHYRLAVPSAKVGLPEVSLGLLPGAGGTQRLPRIVGAEAALDIMTGGKPLSAARGVEIGLLDAIVAEEALLAGARTFLHDIIARQPPLERVRDQNKRIDEARADPALFDRFREKNGHLFKGYKASAGIVAAVEAAVALPFDEGMARELALFRELIVSTQSLAQRYAFFAERQTGKIPGLAADTPKLAIKRVAITGAGPSTHRVAMMILDMGLPVAAQERAIEAVGDAYARIMHSGRLDATGVDKRMALLTAAGSLDDADLVIDSTPDDRAGPAATPEKTIGMHFPSPDGRNRLVEVVRGTAAADAVVAAAMALVRKAGKVPVLSRDRPGFIARRLWQAQEDAAARLIGEGLSQRRLDRIMSDYGFPMSPAASAPDDSDAGDPVSDHGVLERLLAPIVNEGAQLLEEGVAARASDIDVAMMTGFGWPVYTGGPMFWADMVGLPAIVGTLEREGCGPSLSPLIARLVQDGGQLHETEGD